MSDTPMPSDALVLKPCPFCGGKAAMWASNGAPADDPLAGGTRHVECEDCYASGPGEPPPRDGTAWNTRAMTHEAERVGDLEALLRNVVAHATAGNITDCSGTSLNAICCEISRVRNQMWKHAQETALRDAARATPTQPPGGERAGVGVIQADRDRAEEWREVLSSQESVFSGDLVKQLAADYAAHRLAHQPPANEPELRRRTIEECARVCADMAAAVEDEANLNDPRSHKAGHLMGHGIALRQAEKHIRVLAPTPATREPDLQAGHADTEGDAIALAEHLNCPTCGGSGHIDDAATREPDVAQGVVDEIAAERRRQIETLGWTLAHDDEHDRDAALSSAAACYAVADDGVGPGGLFRITHLQTPKQVWPHRWEWKPKDRRANLIRAAALLVAEIERLDRAAFHAAGQSAADVGGE